jgi:hypothetical protein
MSYRSISFSSCKDKIILISESTVFYLSPARSNLTTGVSKSSFFEGLSIFTSFFAFPTSKFAFEGYLAVSLFLFFSL